MERREFMKMAVLLAAAPTLMPGRVTASAGDWRLGFGGVSTDLPSLAMQLEGEIPEDCYGTLYRNGPALYQRGEQRYQHWFDPDGMIQAFCLGPQGVTHQGRFVRTRKYQQEQAAGRFLFHGAGTVFPDSMPVRNNESTNAANINIQQFNGELLALWEAGSPYSIEAGSLDTLGQRHWGEGLQGMPFSAHPHFDAAGDLWNIGAAPWASRPTLVLYHIGKNGRLKKFSLQPVDSMGYIHDFVLTPHHLVVLNSSSLMSPGGSFVDCMRWTSERPSQLLFFDRDDFSLVKTLEVPASFVFHFGNAWEDSGLLCFTACEYQDDAVATRAMYHLAQRVPTAAIPGSRLVRYAVDMAAARVEKTDLGINLEFPGFDRGRPFLAQALIGVAGGQAVNAGLSGAIARVDPCTGLHDVYHYGEHVIVEEPQLIPSASGDYIVHSYLDLQQQRTGLAILRADNLRQGPVARAVMDRIVPLGFHGCFMSAS